MKVPPIPETLRTYLPLSGRQGTISSMANRSTAHVDERGRVSLKSFGLVDTDVIVERADDGSVTLSPAVVLTAAEARHYGSPEAVHRLEEGLESVMREEVRPLRLRTQAE